MRSKPLRGGTIGIAIFNLFAAFIYSIAIVDKLHIEGGIRIPVQIELLYCMEFACAYRTSDCKDNP